MSSPSEKKIKVLDCTFRDGGYYNHWDFDGETVEYYFKAIEGANIDAVEVGFRLLPEKESFLGPFAYCTDAYLQSINLPRHALIGVMINAKDYLNYSGGLNKALGISFAEAKDSPVKLVRVAAHLSEVQRSVDLCEALRKKGYRLGFNLMQVGGMEPKKLEKLAQEVYAWNLVDVLYFADSFGNMRSHEVRNVIEVLSSQWKGELGIHAHNNMNLALSNTLTALGHGVQWLDSTVLGMGRGAGNTCTEQLLLELNQMGYSQYNPEPILPLVLENFNALQEEHGWGSNLLYYLSALYRVHPTYIQEMLKLKNRYRAESVLSALDFLKKSGGTSYNSDNLREAVYAEVATKEGTWDAERCLEGKTVLILGSGPGTKKYQEGIINYIVREKPYVISLNINPYIPTQHIDAYAACHQTRLLLDADKYHKLEKPIYVPVGAVPASVKSKFGGVNVRDYGLNVKFNAFEAKGQSCTIPSLLVFGYVLALATVGKAQKVIMAGFDGYENEDPRQDEMLHLLKIYKNCQNAVPLVSVTPTTYPVDKASIYSPLLP